MLLCTRGDSPDLAALLGALRARSVEPILFDSSAFPTSAVLSLARGPGGARWTATPGDPESGAIESIGAAWHSLVIGSALPAMAPGMRETCVAASELAITGWLDSLDVFQVDPQWRKARADNKPYQLHIAQALGLAVPETLITNDADAVRAFARRVGPLVTKMLVQPASTGPSSDEADVMFTTALDDDALAQLDGLELCPMIFQAQIANLRDLRVTVVGRRVFGAALDAPVRDGGDLDWRRDAYARDEAPRWRPCDVPAALAAPLLRLLDHFGLQYGAADFVVPADGQPRFLELNASGSFSFLGELAPAIADALAELLVDPASRRAIAPP